MKPIRRILVAIKEPGARRSPALEKAAQLAQACGAGIELFHAIGQPVFLEFELRAGSLEELRQLRKAEVCRRLEKLAVRSRVPDGVTVGTSAHWDYPPHEAIVRRALAVRADLIVAEAHAGPRRFPWITRLTDWELLRHSPVPVLLVKSRSAYRNPPVLAAVDPGHTFAKPSRLDDDILAAATNVADALRGALHVVHAYVPMPESALPLESLSSEAVESLNERARKEARARFVRLLKQYGVARTRGHLVARYPTEAIPMTARRVKAQIVVMGAVSRSGLKRIFIGNTAEGAFAQIGCDILVVKPREFSSGIRAKRRGMKLMTQDPGMGYY